MAGVILHLGGGAAGLRQALSIEPATRPSVTVTNQGPDMVVISGTGHVNVSARGTALIGTGAAGLYAEAKGDEGAVLRVDLSL
ncbi:DUF1439 domain-containing protein [Falsiroseomonas selenitidurans]|uniref:DUF1439 domain-containing protein n=1 Tax=Falsiroseomonas selenitidurans TaxID=2716335 RepID=A0ABX1DZI0_9PROT|nr:DUF1439 domain-containing protein [Falsiroseomonas selenitidurans]NKC30317.1 DUF1439 domain-containing protein [Falsiroseomonas selenitidurans]OYW10728.1 MAG: hypothetical protein B7Z53_00255 [Rhodospirillales bacterium 12-71-4]